MIWNLKTKEKKFLIKHRPLLSLKLRQHGDWCGPEHNSPLFHRKWLSERFSWQWFKTICSPASPGIIGSSISRQQHQTPFISSFSLEEEICLVLSPLGNCSSVAGDRKSYPQQPCYSDDTVYGTWYNGILYFFRKAKLNLISSNKGTRISGKGVKHIRILVIS